MILVANIGKDEWRGTCAAYSLLELPVRLVSIVFFDADQLPLDRVWKECAVSFLAGLLGLCIGNVVAPRISHANFRGVILVLLLIGGLVLLTAGSGFLTLWVTLGAAVSLIVVMGFRTRTACCVWRRREALIDDLQPPPCSSTI